jgi:hypothetical protein
MAEELPAVDYIAEDCALPISTEWIDGRTGRPLRRTTIDMLLRTLSKTDVSASVRRLHAAARLQCSFPSIEDRDRFAHEFKQARVRQAAQTTGTARGHSVARWSSQRLFPI